MATYPSTTSTACTSDITVTNGGNVGIGTTSPSTPLHIVDSANEVSKITVYNVNNGASAGTGVQLVSYQGVAAVTKYGGSNTSKPKHLELNSGSSAPLTLLTNNTERVRVLDSGEVGIGTSNPGEKLEVAGNIKASGLIEAGGCIFVDANGYFRPKISADSGTPNNSIYFSTTRNKLVYRSSDGNLFDLY